jgi:hypothetical protein
MKVNSSPVGVASAIGFDNVDQSNVLLNSLADSQAPSAAVAASPTKAVKVTAWFQDFASSRQLKFSPVGIRAKYVPRPLRVLFPPRSSEDQPQPRR